MPSRRYSTRLLLLLAALLAGQCRPLLAADLLTLFTTPQERQIINSNRYKDDTPKPPIESEQVTELPIQPLAEEEVTQKYEINGITVSPEGAHSVWINSIVYQDGDRLDDNSKVKVLVGDEIRVRITAPDGKHYYASSGQSLEVSYRVTIQN